MESHAPPTCRGPGVDQQEVVSALQRVRHQRPGAKGVALLGPWQGHGHPLEQLPPGKQHATAAVIAVVVHDGALERPAVGPRPGIQVACSGAPSVAVSVTL